MSLKKELESFAIWYIPFALLAETLPSIARYYISSNDIGDFGGLTHARMLTEATLLPHHLLPFVVGFWLFFQVKKQGGRTILWFFFGLVSSLFGVILYFLIRLYEFQSDKQKLSN